MNPENNFSKGIQACSREAEVEPCFHLGLQGQHAHEQTLSPFFIYFFFLTNKRAVTTVKCQRKYNSGAIVP